MQNIEYGFWVAVDDHSAMYGKGNTPYRVSVKEYKGGFYYVK